MFQHLYSSLLLMSAGIPSTLCGPATSHNSFIRSFNIVSVPSQRPFHWLSHKNGSFQNWFLQNWLFQNWWSTWTDPDSFIHSVKRFQYHLGSKLKINSLALPQKLVISKLVIWKLVVDFNQPQLIHSFDQSIKRFQHRFASKPKAGSLAVPQKLVISKLVIPQIGGRRYRPSTGHNSFIHSNILDIFGWAVDWTRWEFGRN